MKISCHVVGHFFWFCAAQQTKIERKQCDYQDCFYEQVRETREDHLAVNAKSCLYSQRILFCSQYAGFATLLLGFKEKRMSQLCNVNDKGAANEREKIRQPTCLSANLRLTKTLAPLARNYKIRLSCSSPPTSKFLIVFCGKNVLTSIHGQISPELSKEDSTVKEIYTKTIISTIKNRKRERNTKEIC